MASPARRTDPIRGRLGWRAFCVCAGAALGLAACTAEQPTAPTVTGDYSERPLSDGARVLPPSGRAPASPPSPESCGALASLRPGPPVTPDAIPPGGPLADITARGRLTVGLDQNTNLLSFRDPKTGTLEGFEVDLAREIARDIFGDPSKIEFRLLTSDGRFEALENDAVDVVVHATTITCERAQRVGFSTVYFQASQRLLVPADSAIAGPADLDGRRVCTYIDTTSLATIQRVAPQATIVAVPDWDDYLTTLQRGQADAASTDDSILAGLAAQDPNLKIVGPELESEPYGIGVNKHHDELVRFVNGTLERLRADGTWMTLYDKWMTPLGPAAGPPGALYRD
ncbi:glutamate ABC transporter substrate-binding protein [Rhodococcus opacus]|uniref:glutamate ABC transporter substrate-binding protein n=1 Tax=Rhodococcus opacus TaxID=37919 RepID=UPI00386A442A